MPDCVGHIAGHDHAAQGPEDVPYDFGVVPLESLV